MLYVLKNASPKLRRAIVRLAPDELIYAINEIAYNILHGNHKVKRQKKDELEKYKSELRKLTKPSRTLTPKRKVLVQSGGSFLPILSSTVLSGVIGKYLN